MPPAVRFMDPDIPHCSPMFRLGCSKNVFVNLRGWSRMGDINTPHLRTGNPCPGHVAPIAIGCKTVFVNLRGAGRTGDYIAGCTVCGPGSLNVFAGTLTGT